MTVPTEVIRPPAMWSPTLTFRLVNLRGIFSFRIPSLAYKVGATRSGYLTRFLLENMLSKAEKLDVCVRYRHQIGEFVNEGTIICHVWDAKTRETDVDVKLSTRVFECIPYEEESWKELTKEQLVERKLGVFAADGVLLSKKRSSDVDVTLGLTLWPKNCSHATQIFGRYFLDAFFLIFRC